VGGKRSYKDFNGKGRGGESAKKKGVTGGEGRGTPAPLRVKIRLARRGMGKGL